MTNKKTLNHIRFKFILIFLMALTSATRLYADEPLEEMGYVLRFGFIKGGKATLVAQKDKINRKPVIHYRMAGRTTGLVDKLYEVNDIYESWVDPETSLPEKSIRNIKEQKYRFYDVVTYDHKNDSLFSQKSGRIKVPDKVNDLVSVFFYIRQNHYFEKLLAGEKIQIPVYHGTELFLMELTLLGTETIDTKLGKTECYVVSPKVPKGKLFKTSNALKIYITKDENRLPIYAEFELALGALKCELYSYKINGKDQMVNKEGTSNSTHESQRTD